MHRQLERADLADQTQEARVSSFRHSWNRLLRFAVLCAHTTMPCAALIVVSAAKRNSVESIRMPRTRFLLLALQCLGLLLPLSTDLLMLILLRGWYAILVSFSLDPNILAMDSDC